MVTEMNTVDLLMKEFGTCEIPLKDICDKYLGLNITNANRLAKNYLLPFPAHRCGSTKSPWLVNVNDLSNYLDQQRKESCCLWEQMHSWG